MNEFETLLCSARTAVDRWLKAHIGNRADAEDVLQETCLAAFQGFSGLQNKASFLPWILGIVRRKCADWYRAQAKRKVVLLEHLPDQVESVPDDSAVNETLEIPGLGELTGAGEITELEDAAMEILADLKDLLSELSGGLAGEKSGERARVEQAASRLNTLESEVKLVINALGIDTVSRLLDSEEK